MKQQKVCGFILKLKQVILMQILLMIIILNLLTLSGLSFFDQPQPGETNDSPLSKILTTQKC